MQTYFFRTAVGAELDLQLVKRNSLAVAIEIKLSSVPQIRRGITAVLMDLEPTHSAVITPMACSFPLKDKCVEYGVEDF